MPFAFNTEYTEYPGSPGYTESAGPLSLRRGSTVPGGDSSVGEARSAVTVGLWASATRCVLQYVVAPVLGAAGFWVGTMGLLLMVLGAVTSASGAVRLHRLGHRLWPLYAFVATVVAAACPWAFLVQAGVVS